MYPYHIPKITSICVYFWGMTLRILRKFSKIRHSAISLTVYNLQSLSVAKIVNWIFLPCIWKVCASKFFTCLRCGFSQALYSTIRKNNFKLFMSNSVQIFTPLWKEINLYYMQRLSSCLTKTTRFWSYKKKITNA